MSSAEWKEYLRELKTSSETPDLQSFAERALLLSRAEEVLQSSEIEAITYELVPPRMDTETPPGDFLIYHRDYFKGRLILDLSPTIPEALTQEQITQLGVIFSSYVDLNAVIITYNDDDLTSLGIRQHDLDMLPKPERFAEVLKGPLATVLMRLLRDSRMALAELKPLDERVEPRFDTDAIISNLHQELKQEFDKMKRGRYRRHRKEAANSATEEELAEIERLLTEALRSGQSPEADFIQSILRRFDQND